jgi:NAD/NADP transhydrogenase alpha subunit
MRPAWGDGRADAGALDRVASVLPISQPAGVAADVAVAMSLEGLNRGARVLAVMAGGVDDNLVVAAQHFQLTEPGMCLARKVHPPTVMTSLMSSLASSLALSCCLLIVSIGRFFPSGMTYSR